MRCVEQRTSSADINSNLFSQEFFDQLRNKISIRLFQNASYLHDPICKSHEFFRRIYVVDVLNPTSYKVINYIRKFFFINAVISFGYIGLFTASLGVALKCLGLNLQKKNFNYLKGNAKEKNLKEKTFSVLFWNVCLPKGGFCISDGGVVPCSDRIDKIIDKIKDIDADVICLCEVFDIKDALYIFEKLKNIYSDFYFNIGHRSIGVSSGIFVASKFKTINPEFVVFPKEYLLGRSKKGEKGAFSFDLVSQEKDFARIYTTHLQFSHEPGFSTGEEKAAREKQMGLIVKEIDKMNNKAVVVTGDLNLDDEEYEKSIWKKYFFKKTLYPDSKYTWGGEHFCAKMLGKRISPSSNLDHTMALKNTVRKIETILIDAGYEADKFKKEALSDHNGLFTAVTI